MIELRSYWNWIHLVSCDCCLYTNEISVQHSEIISEHACWPEKFYDEEPIRSTVVPKLFLNKNRATCELRTYFNFSNLVLACLNSNTRSIRNISNDITVIIKFCSVILLVAILLRVLTSLITTIVTALQIVSQYFCPLYLNTLQTSRCRSATAVP